MLDFSYLISWLTSTKCSPSIAAAFLEVESVKLLWICDASVCMLSDLSPCRSECSQNLELVKNLKGRIFCARWKGCLLGVTEQSRQSVAQSQKTTTLVCPCDGWLGISASHRHRRRIILWATVLLPLRHPTNLLWWRRQFQLVGRSTSPHGSRPRLVALSPHLSKQHCLGLKLAMAFSSNLWHQSDNHRSVDGWRRTCRG